MPASRWNTTIDEILNWINDDSVDLADFTLSPILTHVQNKDEGGEGETLTQADKEVPIPDVLPVLPLRGLVVYPQTAVPLTIGQPRSIRLVDDAMAGDKLIGLVTSKNPELENPGPDDLYAIGTVAIIHRMFRAPDGTIRLLVQGLDPL